MTLDRNRLSPGPPSAARLQLRKLILPPPRHIGDLDVLVPLLGQRRAADIAADEPGSRGPDLRPERKRGVDPHHRAGLPVERQRAVTEGSSVPPGSASTTIRSRAGCMRKAQAPF